MTGDALDAREERIGRVIVTLRRYPYPSTLEAADLLAELWGELRPRLTPTARQTPSFNDVPLPLEFQP